MHYTLLYMTLMGALIGLFVVWTVVCCIKLILCNKQRTRNSMQSRPIPYTESRARLIQNSQELPTCVSYFDLPAAIPKCERLEPPPSYEEAVGVHRPRHQHHQASAAHQQPITQPIVTALSDTTQPNTSANYTRNDIATRRADTVVVTVNENQASPARFIC